MKEDFLTKALSLATIFSYTEAVAATLSTWHLLPVHFLWDSLVPEVGKCPHFFCFPPSPSQRKYRPHFIITLKIVTALPHPFSHL